MATTCDQLRAELAALEAQLRGDQEELKDASGQLKAALVALIRATKDRMREVQAELDRAGCAPPSRRSNLRIVGVERTQATQLFRSRAGPCIHRPGSNGPCEPNDIPMVAGKAMVLRVSVDESDFAEFPDIATISGVVQTRPVGRDAFDLPLTPFNAPIAARSAAEIDPTVSNHTLNFRIPANRCRDEIEVRVIVFDAARPGESGRTSNTVVQRIRFVDAQALKIRLVRIRYQNDDRGFDLPAPSTQDFWTTAQYVLKTFPIPGIEVLLDTEELYDGDFTSFFASGGPGAQGTTGTIFEILTNLALAEEFPGDVQYFALIPGGGANQAASGWAISRRNIGTVFQGSTMAQELTHNCCPPGEACRGHAPCGAPPGVDPNYPDYPAIGLPAGSIGEVGFDIVNGNALDPATTVDFMSYCSPTWVSPYSYEGLLRCFGRVFSAAAGAEVDDRPRALLHFDLAIQRDRTLVHRGPVFRTVGRLAPKAGERSPYTVELRDQEGRILHSQGLFLNDVHRDFDEAALDFPVTIPWHEEAARVNVIAGEECLLSMDVGETAPRVRIDSPAGGATLGGTQTVKWSVEACEDPAVHVLRYSSDGGASWIALAAGTSATELVVDLDRLPGGEECLFQVQTSAGLRTSSAVTQPFSVEPKALRPEIVLPATGTSHVEGSSVHLYGIARSVTASASSETLQWHSSIDGYLGSGSQLVLHALSVGRHCLTLSSDDGCGSEARTSVVLTVHRRGHGRVSVGDLPDRVLAARPSGRGQGAGEVELDPRAGRAANPSRESAGAALRTLAPGAFPLPSG